MSELDPEVVTVLAAAQQHGVIGKAPLESHIQQAAAFFEVVQNEVASNGRVLDLGTGGGLPGLVIAAQWPTLSVSLLDGRNSRVESLLHALEQISWGTRVQVIAQRAEEAGRQAGLRQSFDLVVARGFGPPAVTAECAAPFLRRGGYLVVSDPPGGGAEERWPISGCSLFGLQVCRSQVDPWAFTVLQQIALCNDTYPRRTGLPLKRPLF